MKQNVNNDVSKGSPIVGQSGHKSLQAIAKTWKSVQVFPELKTSSSMLQETLLSSLFINHNYNKILESGWLAFIGQLGTDH